MASNIISVGKPQSVTAFAAIGSATGVEVTFNPITPLTTDTFKYWAVDADGTTVRISERDVGEVTLGEGESWGSVTQQLAHS